MAFHTPLRYPGGKRRLVGAVTTLLEHNGLADVQYVEPFAGGAAIGLALLQSEHASIIHINDLSRPVYAFWNTVLHDCNWLCRRIQRVRVSMEEWRRQRKVYEQRESADLDELGFATLFLNRTNRSGIIGGGVIGGKQQSGKWKLDVRFTKDDLIQRIKRIARMRSRIVLYQMDSLRFTKTIIPQINNAFVFYDPPYIENGNGLYLNTFTIDDHRAHSTAVARVSQPWIVTYDYSAVKHRLFSDYRRLVYGIQYAAQGRYRGEEVMYFSDGIAIPEIAELTRPNNSGYGQTLFPVMRKSRLRLTG